MKFLNNAIQKHQIDAKNIHQFKQKNKNGGKKLQDQFAIKINNLVYDSNLPPLIKIVNTTAQPDAVQRTSLRV